MGKLQDFHAPALVVVADKLQAGRFNLVDKVRVDLIAVAVTLRHRRHVAVQLAYNTCC